MLLVLIAFCLNKKLQQDNAILESTRVMTVHVPVYRID